MFGEPQVVCGGVWVLMLNLELSLMHPIMKSLLFHTRRTEQQIKNKAGLDSQLNVNIQSAKQMAPTSYRTIVMIKWDYKLPGTEPMLNNGGYNYY